MLSRNAERVYWLGRYIERTEDTARLLNAFTQVMLDLPKTKKLGWNVLLKIMSVESLFHEHYEEVSEHNVFEFLVTNPENPGSLRSAVRAARENARTSKDLFPLEGWEMLNDLNLLMKQTSVSAIRRRDRFRFLTEVIGRCQQFNGLIQSSMSRNQAHEFLSLGIHIERADMTSRTLDIAAGILLRRGVEESTHDHHIWMEILKAQNAVGMYRAANGPRISHVSVLRFVLCNNDFPRSIKYCLEELSQIALSFPSYETFLETSDKLMKKMDAYTEKDFVVSEDLRVSFDDIQLGLIDLHNIIASTWLYPTQKVEGQTQSQSA